MSGNMIVVRKSIVVSSAIHIMSIVNQREENSTIHIMRKLLNTKKTNISIPYNGDMRKKDRVSPRGNANGLARTPCLPQWLKQENSTTQIMRKLLNMKKNNRSNTI